MKRVLVTGASGFIGHQVLAPLATRGYEVHAVARRPATLDMAGTVWHQADLLNRDSRARLITAVKPSHLLHLAWITDHETYWTSPLNLAWLEASQDLVERFQSAGGARIAVSGTCAEYDWTVPELTQADCVEWLSPCKPASLYGQCKLRFADWLMRRSGLSASWGRLFFLYGPGEDSRRLVPSIILALLAGRVAPIGQGTQQRDFLTNAEAASAFAALLDSTVTGPVNIASGVAIGIADLAYRVGELLGRRNLVLAGAIPPRSGDPSRLVADVTRLNREVGFWPMSDLDAGLVQTISRWRQTVAAGILQAK